MAPFTTFFGDYLHGLWITWSIVDLSADVGFQAEFQANYRARLYKWGWSGTVDSCVANPPCDTLDGTRDYDFDTTAGNTAMATTQQFIFYVAWSNPDAAGTVAKDGIYATSTCTLTTGTTASLDQPALSCVWDTQDIVAGTTQVPPIFFDIKPVNNYDSPSSVYDATDDITVVAQSQLCTELWKISGSNASETLIACVEMGGKVTRKFDTSDTTDDFILDYVEYVMHAKFGHTGQDADVFRFAEQTVNFQDFLASETNSSLIGLSSISIAAASLLVLLGY